MRILQVDPSAYTPPYDHALCAALAQAGADVTLATSRFAYGELPPPAGYERDERAFYAHQPPRARLAAKLAQHIPDMLRARRRAAAYDIVHFQWLALQHLDAALLPRNGPPVVLTAHDVLPREQRAPGQRAAQRRLYRRVDAIVVHSKNGRDRLVAEAQADPAKVEVIPHGAFTHLASLEPAPLPFPDPPQPVVLFFGLIRPYKGLDVLLDAWREIDGAELWVVGHPRMDIAKLQDTAAPSVRWLPRFVADAEAAALFRRADVAVLPYRETDQSGVLFTALAFGTPLILSDAGGFPEVEPAVHVPAGDAAALHGALNRLLNDATERERLRAASLHAARTTYSWERIARAHLALYARLP